MAKTIQLKDKTGADVYPLTGANMVDGLANVAKCYTGRRGRQGGIPREVSRIAEEYQRNIQPPYDKDDIISAFENGFMKSQGKITNQNYREMKKIDNMLLVAVVVVLGMGNLAGLGNAAYSINSFYWVPFVIDIPFFIYVCFKLIKAGDIAAKPSEGSGAAHPAQGENVKEDTISDKVRKKGKEGR